MGITYEDFKLLIEVEDLLHNELEKGNYDSDSKEWATFGAYWNLVEKICQWKDNFVHDWDKERGEK